MEEEEADSRGFSAGSSCDDDGHYVEEKIVDVTRECDSDGSGDGDRKVDGCGDVSLHHGSTVVLRKLYQVPINGFDASLFETKQVRHRSKSWYFSV